WLNSLLLVLLVCQLSQATLTGVVAERLLGPWGIVGALLVDIFIVFVLAEAAPKTWAIQHTERAALASARPVRLLIGFPPLRLLARGLIGFTNVILPGKGLKKGPYITEEELLALAEAAVEEEVIEEEERELIESIIEFGDTVVREIMTPRVNMVSIRRDATIDNLKDLIIREKYSRIPVFRDRLDNVEGVVMAKDLLEYADEKHKSQPIEALIRPVAFVPETMPVADLLKEFQKVKQKLAVVVDEHGSVSGLVTMEDVVEEIVGEIQDEYDTEEAQIVANGPLDFTVSGAAEVEELEELFDVDLAKDDFITVGGLIAHTLGRLPQKGEKLMVKGLAVEVLDVDQKRIKKLRIRKP
ncbi:MAG TPA: hemolysin family protein, partial [Burkholderiales bacterium]|nr:hemolysin family protein [Burkholderiales bacterium]